MQERRAKVALLVEACMSQNEIAKTLNVSSSTITYDVRALRKQWKEEQLGNVEKVMTADLHRLEKAVAAIWPNVIAGDYLAIDRLTRIIELRGRILQYGDLANRTGDQVNKNVRMLVREVLIELPDMGPVHSVSELADVIDIEEVKHNGNGGLPANGNGSNGSEPVDDK